VEIDDSMLIDELRRGEPSAFNQLYQRFRPRLYTFLLRLCQRTELAEDLLQETWMRVAANARALAPGSQLERWLFTVARNTFRSHRRWALLDATRLWELAREPKPNIVPSPLLALAANELQREAERALAGLPVKYREALLLVAVEQLEPLEASRVLGIRPDALRQRLSRGRAMLAQRLGQERLDTLQEGVTP
jgi:RNA polymerase sigma-70 factor (ECF subfamily)